MFATDNSYEKGEEKEILKSDYYDSALFPNNSCQIVSLFLTVTS
jgi:hypothetical protein